MAHQVTLGGDRLGSGKRQKISLKSYERSTHDLSTVWRSTMAAGTLVPFLSKVALPGDTWDINLNADVLTLPTIGPLFGTYKVQLDIFQIPIRLYQGKLHQNMLGIGLDMSKVPLPQAELGGNKLDPTTTIDNQQMNPSCIFSYLGIRGLGYHNPNALVNRRFNAIPFLGYWDTYKNYYANKQEEIGAVIHRDPNPEEIEIDEATITMLGNDTPYVIPNETDYSSPQALVLATGVHVIVTGDFTANSDPQRIMFDLQTIDGGFPRDYKMTELFINCNIDVEQGIAYANGWNPNIPKAELDLLEWNFVWYNQNPMIDPNGPPKIVTFDLKNIDTIRGELLSHLTDDPFVLNASTIAPYGLPMDNVAVADGYYSMSQLYAQEGLALKTYNSDLFNNWISTEWIDGTDGITDITSIDTSGGSFTIDELNLNKKVYDMLNRIAVSGGSYDDWLDAVYDNDRHRSAENPMYLGGLIQNLVFQEVISNAATAEQPLGTLAGRGRTGNKRKGGHVIAKIDEPSYIMGIVSITPNVDYSQGNEWDTNLQTMNDLHKPALDEIGFQDLITNQMAWWDTQIAAGIATYKSAGKQPAWINYMTSVNRVLGNFAIQNEQMFMVLNRRYDVKWTAGIPSIRDLTTYIDPSKFNHIFADTRLDAQNFWTQIGIDIECRRKISAKVIPNL